MAKRNGTKKAAAKKQTLNNREQTDRLGGGGLGETGDGDKEVYL